MLGYAANIPVVLEDEYVKNQQTDNKWLKKAHLRLQLIKMNYESNPSEMLYNKFTAIATQNNELSNSRFQERKCYHV